MVSQYGAVFVSLRVGIVPALNPVVDGSGTDLKVPSQFFDGKFFGPLQKALGFRSDNESN